MASSYVDFSPIFLGHVAVNEILYILYVRLLPYTMYVTLGIQGSINNNRITACDLVITGADIPYLFFLARVQ